jgi:hypothetical protein
MSNLNLVLTDSLLNRLTEEANGAGLFNGMGLASALMLMQGRAEGVPTLSPVTSALEALTVTLVGVEPGLTSLSERVSPQVLNTLKEKAELLSWSDLVAQSKHLTSELADATVAADGLPADTLGLESLVALQEDLQGMEDHLPDLMDVSPLNTSSSIVASLNDGTSLFDPQPADQVSAEIAQAESLKMLESGDAVHRVGESVQAPADWSTSLSDAVAVETVETNFVPVDEPAGSITETPAAVVTGSGAGAGFLDPLTGITDTLEGTTGEGALDPVVDIVDEVVAVTEQSVDGVEDGVDQLVNGVADAVDDVLGGVIDVVEGIVGEGTLEPVADLVDEVLEGVGDVVSGVTDGLEGVLGDGALDPVDDLVEDVLGGVTGVVDGVLGEGDALEATGDLVDDVLDGTGEVVGGVTDGLEGVLGDGALDPVDDLVEDVLGGVSGVVDGALGNGDALDGAGDLVEDVLGGVSGVVDGVLGGGDADVPVSDLVDDLIGGDALEPVTEVVEEALVPVTDLVESALDPVSDLVDDLPLVGGILPLVESDSNDEGSGGGLLGGLLG